MEDSTFPDPYVQKFLDNFELAKINVETDSILAERYGVKSYPTILVARPEGVEVDRHVGFKPPQELVTAIINSLSGIGTLENLLARLATNPDSLALVYDVAAKYMYRGDYLKARAYFKRLLREDSGNITGLASTAAYRLAYMRYKEKEYEDAAAGYAAVVTDYPTAAEAMESRLMVAYCYQKAENYKKAKQEYRQFLEDFPDTEEREWIEEQLDKMK